MDPTFELPLQPLDFPGEKVFRLLLRNGPKAGEDALAAISLVDRPPAETIDRDPARACTRHVIPPAVMDALAEALILSD